MESFYVTLPSNASFDVYPDNKKSNYTTQFNTPLILDGPYEVALANITCTPNIRNDYGEIIIKNFLSHLPLIFDDNNNNNLNELSLDLSDAKNLRDKINTDVQEYITFNQIIITSWMKYHMNTTKIKPRFSDKIVPVFLDITKDFDEALYYIPKGYNPKFERVAKSFTISGAFLEITEENLYDELTDEFNLEFYPYAEEIVILINNVYNTPNDIDKLLNNDKSFSKLLLEMSKIFRKRQLNHPISIDPIFLKIFNKFDNIYNKIKLFHLIDTGLIILHAEENDNKLKLTSNKNLEMIAKGLCNELIFHNKNIVLNKYYHYPGKFNLVKFGIIYCDIIQEQIVGEDYRQVLQIITLDNAENSQVISNNLDPQYVPVKKNFITSINVSIKSLTGEFIKFEDDFIYTICKLHFRKTL